MPYKPYTDLPQIDINSRILQYLYLKHQYLIINNYLFIEIFLEIKKNINRTTVTLFENKIYTIMRTLLNALYRVEDFMTLNNEIEYENVSELEVLLQKELSNPEYYTIETLRENKEVSKDDITDLKRFTFKNFQDILERIEANNKNKELVIEMENVTKKLRKEMAEGAVEIFNLIFDIGRSLEGDPDNKLNPVIQISLEKAKQILLNLDVQEIPVYGKELDGNYMTSIGTVKNNINVSIPQDHVAVVYKKAFRLKDTNKVIQTALVKTIE